MENETSVTANVVGGITPFAWDIHGLQPPLQQILGKDMSVTGVLSAVRLRYRGNATLEDAVGDMSNDLRFEQGVKPTAGLSKEA